MVQMPIIRLSSNIWTS